MPPSILEILRFLSGGVCHQLPDRSLQALGIVSPLCARCTGTYLGAFTGLLTVLVRGRARASLLPRWPTLAAFALFFVLWGVDGLNSYLTLIPGAPYLYQPNNGLRLLTGTLEGIALSLAIWPLVASTLWDRPDQIEVICFRELLLLVAAASGIAVVFNRPLAVTLYLGALLSAVGLFGMFAILNALLLIAILRREGTVEHFSQLMPLLGAALVASVIELATLGFLRRLLLGF